MKLSRGERCYANYQIWPPIVTDASQSIGRGTAIRLARYFEAAVMAARLVWGTLDLEYDAVVI